MKIYSIILVVLFILITIGTVSASTFTVNNSTGDVADFTSIQAAIDDVNTTNEDTILVYQGTYTENVTVNKELTINSHPDNLGDTIVQTANPNNSVFYVTEDNVTINGFNVTGANNYVGILLNGVNGCNISDNSLSNNFVGIRLDQSSNNMLSNNIANSNSDTGIGLVNSSDSNTLTNNIANSNTDTGIWLFGSSNNMLNSNIILNNEFGIRLVNSSNSNTLTNNTASSNNDAGIRLEQSSNGNNLSSNIALNNIFGIGLQQSSNSNKLTNNTANSNTNTGIWLSESINNMLSSNIVLNNNFGIGLQQSSNSNTLTNNTANSNTDAGIRMQQSSNNNTLTNNNANSNGDTGIGLLNSSDNSLSSNIVSNNFDDGIYFEGSNNTLLYNNYFNNTNNVEYVGINNGNIWNITMTAGTNIVGGHLLGGNYWVHPNGTGFSVDTADNNTDGICDEQYNLSVTESDYLPLIIVVDTLMPVISITSPADGSSTTASSVTVSGLVNGTGSLPLVTVNDINAETTIIEFNGTFTATVPLVIGANTIYANVTDAAGNTNTTFVNIARTSSSGSNGGGSSGGIGTPVIIPIQEEPKVEEENTTSDSNATNNVTIVAPEEEVVEEPQEPQGETEATPGFSIMLTTGVLLSAYVIYKRKD